ncbi:MAG: hypothetical protein A7316_01065 [Candidatus Altiarchaeales archaeon WOR_SM1_86-2]|nr:MAG: hypothetical protein A7315_13225 [Candidatus Altiarchaeales archaeon WOR_SM1_79]ODS38233.1 MAG: hypothetical protein A7316_01065 [Candidatus Altiarchaeales archaeon WOR_SM1_86-2]
MIYPSGSKKIFSDFEKKSEFLFCFKDGYIIIFYKIIFIIRVINYKRNSRTVRINAAKLHFIIRE